MNRDFLDLDPSEYVDVEYIVLDPSCSGSGKFLFRAKKMQFTELGCRASVSGMVNREGESDMSEQRLQSLAAVQARLLRHALSFPNVKKVVYSTCSTSSEENEEVVGVKEGDCCKNNGCKATYPPTSDECKYHPGFPVFHEVSKLINFNAMFIKSQINC